MQQRRLRLGDILDDYCPRERRITNHVVVAMIEDEVKQTRCSTCDADHEYKQAKAPASRRRKPAAALAGDVADAPRPRPVAASRPGTAAPLDAADPDSVHAAPVDADLISEPAADYRLPFASDADADADGADREAEDEAVRETSDETAAFDQLAEDGEGGEALHASADEAGQEEGGADRVDDDGPVHRPLIRATLPRPEGQAPERKEPDFTFRNGRGFDGNREGGRDGNRNGHRQHRGPRQKQAHGNQGNRFGPPRQGSGQGQRFGFGQGSGQGQGQGQGSRHGNRQGQGHGTGAGPRNGRPAGPGRGSRPGQGPGRGPKRGR